MFTLVTLGVYSCSSGFTIPITYRDDLNLKSRHIKVSGTKITPRRRVNDVTPLRGTVLGTSTCQ